MMRTNGCPDDDFNCKLDAMAGCIDDTPYTRRLQATRPCKFVTDALPWGNYSPDPHADNTRYEMVHKPMPEYMPVDPTKTTCLYQGRDLTGELTHITFNRNNVERHRPLEAWDDHRARFFRYREQQEDADETEGDGGGNRRIEPPDPSSSSSHNPNAGRYDDAGGNRRIEPADSPKWPPYEGTPTACLKDFQKQYMHCDSMDMLILRLANMEQPGGEDDKFPGNRKPRRRDNEENPAYIFINTMLAYLVPPNERHIINLWCLDEKYFKSARTTHTSASDLHALTSTCWTVMSRWYALELFPPMSCVADSAGFTISRRTTHGRSCSFPVRDLTNSTQQSSNRLSRSSGRRFTRLTKDMRTRHCGKDESNKERKGTGP
jgi:hypothetical protein